MNVGDLQSMLSVEHSPMMGLGGTASGAPDSPSFAALLEQESTVRDAAQKLVSSSLVLPILASIRDGGQFMQEPFKPGVVERRFGPLLDQALADEITTSSRFDLVDSIVEQFTRDVAAPKVEVDA
ncbi:MAG: hypothetical protein CMJ41_06860 [Phycisphaerae bacterium]|nr:hypothetical protein [Phycisphaerae bacterium]